MENKNYEISNMVNYLGNGKVSSETNNIHSTKFSKREKNINQVGNGKSFTKEFKTAFDDNKIKNQNINNIQKSSVLSWLINTVNPLNHLPVVSTINKFTNKTYKSLDMAQSAIGGVIYGGPLGFAKGLGSWFISKLIPSGAFASNFKSKKNDQLIINNLAINEVNQLEKNIQSKKNRQDSNIQIKHTPKKLNNIVKESNLINNEINSKQKAQYNNFFYYYSNEKLSKKSKIDIDA